MDYLKTIEVDFSSRDRAFTSELLAFIKRFSQVPDPGLYPHIEFKDQSATPHTRFITATDADIIVDIANTTGITKSSSYKYDAISLKEFLKRLEEFDIAYFDHFGMNLPWFKHSINPQLQVLREQLKGVCLYHLYPSGEDWDFIIPGTINEITGSEPVDYARERKPKFEIVSTNVSSIPLIQIDLTLEQQFQEICAAFPEAIADESIKCCWVCLKNETGIDVWMSLNHRGKGWTSFFDGSRI